ncbi:MAG: septum formation initiator family protein [Crocinitomicaceae bacterium]|nr:septum formation initiator family protein [Crocinitomicaceae bacterium]
MKKLLPYLKNKFILATVIFLVYALFLDENDLFTIIRHNRKLNQLEIAKQEVSRDLEKSRETLRELNSKSELERYAREEKYFKKDDEDIFVIFEE